MKIAVATKDFLTVSGHAGQAKAWLLWDLTEHHSTQLLPLPQQVTLLPEQVLHHFKDDGPHPLDGVDVVIAASAGDGFVRHMRQRGTDVLLTGEDDPVAALTAVLAGQALPDTRFDFTTLLCKLRDRFSRY